MKHTNVFMLREKRIYNTKLEPRSQFKFSKQSCTVHLSSDVQPRNPYSVRLYPSPAPGPGWSSEGPGIAAGIAAGMVGLDGWLAARKMSRMVRQQTVIDRTKLRRKEPTWYSLPMTSSESRRRRCTNPSMMLTSEELPFPGNSPLTNFRN